MIPAVRFNTPQMQQKQNFGICPHPSMCYRIQEEIEKDIPPSLTVRLLRKVGILKTPAQKAEIASRKAKPLIFSEEAILRNARPMTDEEYIRARCI